ncbi:MAG: carboxypeptidase-like regulatory domain-containing protein [Armatimonadetes bacterium]|nr:carboxypeptidase-like regulatory domain-containing protein [Armatimonadota bacterium]
MAYQLTSFDLVAAQNSGVPQQHDFFLLPESRVLISGVVRRPDGLPAHGAVVQFFQKEGNNLGRLIGHTFTDEDGHFLFGPLAPGTEFKVKIFYWDVMQHENQGEVKSSGIFPPVILPPVAPLPPIATLPPVAPFSRSGDNST